MTRNPPTIEPAERVVLDLATELARVRTGECLCCYVYRQLETSPCDGTHRHAVRFQKAVAPRITTLDKRLGRLGACCCDCELFVNGYEPKRSLWIRERKDSCADDAIEGDELEWDELHRAELNDDARPPDRLPRCAGAGPGVLQPCTHWVRMGRW
jgi:hypothetical protein